MAHHLSDAVYERQYRMALAAALKAGRKPDPTSPAKPAQPERKTP